MFIVRIEQIDNFFAIKFQRVGHLDVLIAHIQGLRHILQQKSALQICPGLRLVVQKFVFKRQGVVVKRLNKMIDPPGVLDDCRMVVHGLKRLFRAEYHAQSALSPVVVKHRIARYDLGNSACSGMRLKFHLPQPMHCRDISLGQIKVIAVFGEDVWNEKAVINNRNRLLETGYDQLFFALITGGFKVLPESMIRVEKLAQRRNGDTSDRPAPVQKVN
jgi:hypothetical protein